MDNEGSLIGFIRGTFRYLRSFIKDKNVASVTPTSTDAMNYILDLLDLSRDCTIIEFGAGTGVFTFELLNRMTSRSRLIAFETNEELARHIAANQDPRLTVVNESAENISNVLESLGLESAQYIISGIPFSFITPSSREQIIIDSYRTLDENGVLLVYQATYMMKTTMEKVFGNCETDKALLNLPPLFIMKSVKSS